MPKLTLRGGSRGQEIGSVQVTVDGKDYLFQLDRESDDVPQKVVKAAEATGHKFETSSSKEG